MRGRRIIVADIVIVLSVAAIMFFGIRRFIRDNRKGGCAGCSVCGGSAGCAGCSVCGGSARTVQGTSDCAGGKRK